MEPRGQIWDNFRKFTDLTWEIRERDEQGSLLAFRLQQLTKWGYNLQDRDQKRKTRYEEGDEFELPLRHPRRNTQRAGWHVSGVQEKV